MLLNETQTDTAETTADLPMLGRYRLLREIARSNDIVYEATDTRIGRRVALKELNLPPSLSDAARRQRIERFYREARAAGAMNHPNIVTIHEVGEEGGRYYIAMEFLDGGTLRKRLAENGSLSEAEAAAVGLALCDALAYAHERGVIHRDIKPDNVFVSHMTGGEGDPAQPPLLQVKLTDFGIARITHEETMTATGQFFGTPSYMSPEQLSGLPGVDARSDLFSLGVMLWEMVMGRKPFTGDSVPNTMFRILNDPTPTTSGHAPALEPVIAKATAKNPAARYLSANEMRGALAEALRGSGLGLTTASVHGSITKPSTLEKGFVLSVEVVGFDQIAKPLRERLVSGLQSVAVGTEEAKKAAAARKLLCRTAPGGLLIAFFNGDPLSPVRCAVELEKTFRITSAPLAQQLARPLALRMGIASGGVVYSENFQEETTGEGVSITQRIARLGGGATGGNILVSANVAADVLKSPMWSERLFDLGFCDAGDGMRIHLYNLHGFGYGNLALPPGLSPKVPFSAEEAPVPEPLRAARPPLPRSIQAAFVWLTLLMLTGFFGLRNQATVAKTAAELSASTRAMYQGWLRPTPSRARTVLALGQKPGRGVRTAKNSGEAVSAVSVSGAASQSGGNTPSTRVPKLTGISHDTALRRLEAARLTAADADILYDGRYPEGVVFRQRPAPGAQVGPGSAVQLTVSLGPDPDKGAEAEKALQVPTSPKSEVISDNPEPDPDVVETPQEGAADGP
ncbi:MAG: protein kinase [Cytophagales bacterium]|nr:protein kinase [Armatimonadota bacterium]